jgi:hypothetical protein
MARALTGEELNERLQYGELFRLRGVVETYDTRKKPLEYEQRVLLGAGRAEPGNAAGKTGCPHHEGVI